MIHLEVSDHDEADGVGAAGHERAGVDPAPVTVLDDLGVTQKAHHHHHEGSHVTDQTEEAALGRVRTTFTDEGYVLDGATGFREAGTGQLLQASYIVGPVFYRTNMVIHHGHGVNYPYPCDGEGRQADRQDDPGSHWAGSEQTVSGAWVERVGGLRAGVATQHEERAHRVGQCRRRRVVGSLKHRGVHEGRHERTEGETDRAAALLLHRALQPAPVRSLLLPA